MSNRDKFNNRPAPSAEAEVAICLRLGECVGVDCQCVCPSSGLFCKLSTARTHTPHLYSSRRKVSLTICNVLLFHFLLNMKPPPAAQ